MNPEATNQFWLMTGAEPTGPFSIEQIHAEIAAGRATWQTPACLIGGNEWRPVLQTQGIGPDNFPFSSCQQSQHNTGVTQQTGVGGSLPIEVASNDSNLFPNSSQLSAANVANQNTAQKTSTKTRFWIQVFGSSAAIVLLVVGVYWGNDLFSSTPTSTVRDPVNGQFGTSLLDKKSEVIKAPTEANSKSYTGWNLGGPVKIPAHLQDPAVLLIGSWRWDGGGYSSTFVFESSGEVSYYVTGANPISNLPVADSEAYGRWSVRNGTLFIEFTGANNPVHNAIFRGLTAKSNALFTDSNTVQLNGIEGDSVNRTYKRIR